MARKISGAALRRGKDKAYLCASAGMLSVKHQYQTFRSRRGARGAAAWRHDARGMAAAAHRCRLIIVANVPWWCLTRMACVLYRRITFSFCHNIFCTLAASLHRICALLPRVDLSCTMRWAACSWHRHICPLR